MLQFGKYKMDANEIINQLREENEFLKSLNEVLSSGREKVIAAAKELGYQYSAEVSLIDYLIETARASAMVNQKNVELQSQLVAVQDSVVHGKCANSEPCATFCEAIATRKMFKQLQVERDALAAQLAAIQDAALKPRGRTRQQWIDNIKRNVFGVRAVEHLLELKSEAGRAGFIAAYNENKFIMLYEKNIERRADDYAEKIKAGRL